MRTTSNIASLLYKPTTSSSLKAIAVISMFIDHFFVIVYAVLFNRGLIFNPFGDVVEDNIIYVLGRSIGRLAFPLFAFLVAQGMLHTRSQIRYICRLFLMALISEPFFDLALGHPIGYSVGIANQNVFFTLFLGASLIYITNNMSTVSTCKENSPFEVMSTISTHKENSPSKVMSTVSDLNIPLTSESSMAINKTENSTVNIMSTFHCKHPRIAVSVYITLFCLLSVLLCSDYSACGVLVIFLFYHYNNKFYPQALSCSLCLTIGAFVNIVIYALLFNKSHLLSLSVLPNTFTETAISELPAILAFIPISNYNNEKGIQLPKYFYYLFYPVHLVFLWLMVKFFF